MCFSGVKLLRCHWKEESHSSQYDSHYLWLLWLKSLIRHIVYLVNPNLPRYHKTKQNCGVEERTVVWWTEISYRTKVFKGLFAIRFTTKLSLRFQKHSSNTAKPRFTDTRLIRTPYYHGQCALSLGKKPLTFSLNLTRLIRTLSMAPLVWGRSFPRDNAKCPY